ncbi:component of IIS longevity pathway SMK-1-domain-containing protein [Stachybotrys elegans]|uniref:Component of IIS longevity pathway SMK-1-domain-containing protein n=1 Tax=Stachybotrys elegans TaxID=80388 RepID=A0A8K0WRV3_9HYPO|nr:component of IIS longevity pathway SMK-1-domain-containing protein [Stachybotrys elegans]
MALVSPEKNSTIPSQSHSIHIHIISTSITTTTTNPRSRSRIAHLLGASPPCRRPLEPAPDRVCLPHATLVLVSGSNPVISTRVPSVGRDTNATVAALTILSHNETTPELSLQQHLELAPDLVAYNSLVTEGDSEPLMMAQQVPHQATDKKRVKVYELRNNDWFDRGTGFCTATFANGEDGRKDPRVIVESEEQPERLLLETKIMREDGFQKQQETLIVWQEPGSGVDMALSFQEAEGCALIWRFVNSVQQALHNHMTGDDGLSDDLALEVPANITLPTADLGNLAEIESNMRLMTTTATGRDALAKFIMSEDYIGKLIPLVDMAEDLESLPDLHRLCNIMKTVILLNDTSIIEHSVSDECVLGVVGALEYDPDFPSHKANHRQWLDNQGRYKEVVPIEDEQTRRKIHQTYRLQYLKDVVLARILDDPTFSVLNSLIFFNQVDIVQHLQSNAAFLNDLFSIFSPSFRDHKKRKEAVLFIQQCCGIAKNIQPPARQSLYNNFIAHGLLQVIHYGLRHGDVAVRVGATDILISIIDHDPQMIRQTIYRQIHDNQSPLTDCLIDLLLVEVDLGVKSQISEALKVLLDQGVTIQPGQEGLGKTNGEMGGRVRVIPSSDPQQELFLTRFYERSALKLFKPLLDLKGRTDMKFTVHQASMFSYLIEILCFFIRQHHRFSRYFIMEHDIAHRVLQLLHCEEKYLPLVAIRFIRSLVGLQEEFYNRHLQDKLLLGHILGVLEEHLPTDSLLCSAALEIFEFIRKENLKEYVKHVVLAFKDRVYALSHMPTFRDLLTRYEQTLIEEANAESFIEPEEEVPRPPQNFRMMEHITVDPKQDEYWNSPDEDEGEDGSEEKPKANGSSSKPLVDYPSDEEGDEAMDAEGEGESAKDSSKQDTTTAGSSLPSVAPPERLSEKRRREEEDDDELGKLMANKRRNSTSSNGSTGSSGGAARRRKSFTSGSGNGTPKKIAISLSPALRTGGTTRSDEDS